MTCGSLSGCYRERAAPIFESCEIVMEKRELNKLALSLWRRIRTWKLDASMIRQEMKEAELSLQDQKVMLDGQPLPATGHRIYAENLQSEGIMQ